MKIRQYKTVVFFLAISLNVFSLNAQDIEIISGNPKAFKPVKNYHITFDYSDLRIGEYGEEQAYIEYMKDDAERRKKGSSDQWLFRWNEDRRSLFQPNFTELLNKNLNGRNIRGDTVLNGQKYELNLHTSFIEPGFNRNMQRSPALIDATVYIHKIDNPDEKLVISITGVPGKEVMGVYYSDRKRIAEAYAKCGKELAKYMMKKIY